MNEKDLYQNGTVEVSLGDLFWSVLRRWRSIVAIMLIFAVILGGYGFVKEYKKYKDPEVRQKLQNEYDLAVDEYNKDKEKLQRDIVVSEEYQTHLEDYKDRCVFLKFDPYNIYKIDATFFVDSNYEINPSMSYQNTNTIGTLIRAYSTAIQRIDFESVIDMNGEDLTQIHPVSKFSGKKVCVVSVVESAGLMQVTITADTKERAEKIYKEVMSVIDETKTILTTAVGDHEISVVNETALYTVDWDYETLQTSFTDDYYEKNKTKINTLKKNLDDLKEPVNKVPTKGSVIKASLKKGVIGLVAGLFIAAVVYAVLFMIRDWVYTPDSLRGRYRLPMLGVIDLGLNGRKNNKIDRKIAAKLGVPDGLSQEQSASLVASNVKLYLKGADKLLIVGSAGSDAAEKLKNMLQPLLEGTDIAAAGDVNYVSEAVDALSSDAAVICTEQWQKARHSDIVRELDKISAVENKGIGFVVVN